jgi:hypothetical protein
MRSALIFGLCIALVVGVPGCLKTKTETSIKSDGTGTVTFDCSYKQEAIEAMRERIDEMAERIDERGGDLSRVEQQEKRIDEFVGSFSEAKTAEKFKKLGLTVISTKASEKDGWKGMTVKAKFDDVNQVVALHRAARDERRAAATRGEGERRGERGGRRGRRGFGRGLGGAENSIIFIQAFEPTDDPAIGKAILVPARPQREGRDGEGGRRGRGGRGGRGGDRGDMASEFGLDEMKMTTTITLPGKIVSVVGCKKQGDNQVVFEQAAPALGGAVSDEDRAARAKGAHVTFQIPQGCKIKFAKPKPAGEKKDKDSPAKEKKRKGGLGLDGDK